MLNDRRADDAEIVFMRLLMMLLVWISSYCHRWPLDSPHKGPVTQKMFPFDDVIMQHPKMKQYRLRGNLGFCLLNWNINFKSPVVYQCHLTGLSTGMQWCLDFVVWFLSIISHRSGEVTRLLSNTHQREFFKYFEFSPHSVALFPIYKAD